PDLLPPILGYRVEGVREEAGQVQVETLMELEPGLDHVMGLVPARAEGIWVSQEESEGWRVLLDQSALRPLYPEEEGAAEAVGHWVRARQGCGEGRQHPAGLLGVPSLADQLCGSQGEPRLGQVGQVEQLEAAPFLAAFGPEFQQWARVVPVAAPVPLRAVVAPIGDGWTVIGVLAAEQP
ncbi:MAG: hypothetical protein M3N51_10820, partial [Actinomycetota bacterium]|nr:hypothetical protein [Actinomycetota bacterium]